LRRARSAGFMNPKATCQNAKRQRPYDRGGEAKEREAEHSKGVEMTVCLLGVTELEAALGMS